MKRYLQIPLLLFFLVSLSFSEEYIATNRVHHIGGWVGLSTGQGLSYRYRPSDWAIQFQFFPYYYNEEAYFTLGLNYNKYVSDIFSHISLFFYLGGSGVYQSYISNSYDLEDYVIKYHRVIQTIITIGVGPGIEFNFSRIVLNICIGYRFGFQVYPLYSFSTSPTVELGGFYKF